MPVIAYLLVIAIWSTTPLAIKLSNDSVTPIASISLRIIMAVILGLIVVAIIRRVDLFNRRYYKIYFAGSIGIFPNMVLVYYAAQYISSGLLAVLMGMAPFVTGLMAHFVLGDEFFIRRKMFAQVIAIGGLVTVYFSQMSMSDSGVIGVLLMLCSTCLFALSSVWVKRFSMEQKVSALNQTVGAMTFSLPGLLLCWWLIDGNTNIVLSQTSLWSIVYLAVIGSLVGFVVFFYVLNRMSVGLVALILLITPVTALLLGKFFADELVSPSILVGSGLILVGLVMYENLLSLFFKRT